MADEKIEKLEKKEKVEVIQPKLCPLISGFLVEPIKTALGEIKPAKTTNVAPCMKDKCVFFDKKIQECLILCYLIQNTTR